MSEGTWFSAQDFEEYGFDPNVYIKRHSGAVPLNVILQRLQQHVETIRADLINVINADYPLFIGMAERLGGVEGAAMQIQTPMLKLKNALLELQGRYRSELTSLKECLHQQSQVHHTKTMLELVQDATAVMGKVESLTADLPATSAPTSLDQAATTAAQIDRIAGEVSRLSFYMAKGRSVPVVQSLAPRLTRVTSKLCDAISATLHSTLQMASGDADAASSSCIHACSLVNRVELAHSALQEVLVLPALDRAALSAATDASGDTPVSPTHQTDSHPIALSTFLMHAQRELKPQISRIKGMVARHPDLASTFDILGVCTLGQVHATVKVRLPGTFSPADPDAFHRNYSAAVAFLSWLEEQAATEGALQLLQKSTERMAFRKAWNLAVYFSLRFQEIAGAFDEQLRKAPVPAAVGTSCIYQQSNSLLHALHRCRDPTVTFTAVYDRFLKLQMQSILRFAGWLKETHPVQARSGSGFVETPMCQWARSTSSEDLVALLADAYWLASQLRTQELAAIQDQLQSATPQAVLDKVKQGVLATVAQLLHSTSGLEDVIVQRMLIASGSWKRRVLSIAATYRMTARPPPARPSHYVPTLLEAPMALRESPRWRQLPVATQQELLLKVVQAIIGVLKAAAKELLETMAKTQASLSKLGRVRNSPATGQDGGLSDIEKTQEQLRLDVEEFGRNIQLLLGKPAMELVAFNDLLQAAKGLTPKGAEQPGSPMPPGSSLSAGSMCAAEKASAQTSSMSAFPGVIASAVDDVDGMHAQPAL